ncbi:integrator complex subunit 14-like isoform X2 [Artemia franciscana]|uniref:integrator complex subunit 14-like isoform X2 n=1 Tax=Artemia franciscana TaxID=6661 RepID=UPI0032D9E0F8
MPTLAVLDASLSMLVTASKEPGETKLSLALQGLKKFLTHISQCNKLELLSLAAFSSSFDVVFPFSRDYDGIKRHLETIEPCDVSCISVALSRLQSYIYHEWGHAENCQVIFITDGSLGFGRNSMVAKLASNQFSFNESFCFIPVLLIDPSEVTYATSIRTYNRMVELAGQGAVFSPNGDLTIDTVMSMFHRICEVYYAPFTGTITCGCLSETISLCPPPQPAVLSSDTVGRSLQMSSNLKVIGFVQLADLGNPPLLSRHLIVPRPESGLSVVPGDALKSEASTDEDLSIDEGKIPSFCVLLHASLKVKNMAAFCQVADDRFGVIFSRADNKKKSNLMLGLLEPDVPDDVQMIMYHQFNFFFYQVTNNIGCLSPSRNTYGFQLLKT